MFLPFRLGIDKVYHIPADESASRCMEGNIIYSRRQSRAAWLPQLSDEAVSGVTIKCNSPTALKTLAFKTIISKAVMTCREGLLCIRNNLNLCWVPGQSDVEVNEMIEQSVPKYTEPKRHHYKRWNKLKTLWSRIDENKISKLLKTKKFHYHDIYHVTWHCAECGGRWNRW